MNAQDIVTYTVGERVHEIASIQIRDTDTRFSLTSASREGDWLTFLSVENPEVEMCVNVGDIVLVGVKRG